MSAGSSNKGAKKNHHPKKYFYTHYDNSNDSDDSYDPYDDIAAEFEQPKNRRQAKKDFYNRKKRQSADLFY